MDGSLVAVPVQLAHSGGVAYAVGLPLVLMLVLAVLAAAAAGRYVRRGRGSATPPPETARPARRSAEPGRRAESPRPDRPGSGPAGADR